MKNLKGSTAIVTGASRGLGSRIAQALAERGVQLALAARNEAQLAEVRDRIQAATGTRVIVIPTDVGQRASLEKLVQETQDRLGPVDILINNAAVERSVHFQDLSLDEIEEVMAINLTGTVLLTRLVLPGMIERDRGHIVNMGSLAGLAAMAFGELYGATKHGVVGFTRALRASLLQQNSAVQASVICPGFVSEVGMFANKQAETDIQAPAFLGASPPRAVVRAILQAIENDRTETIVTPLPIRPFLLCAVLLPRLAERIAKQLGIFRLSQVAAEASRIDSAPPAAPREDPGAR